jgi:membrane protease YdiL (CAAX protease family)
MLDHVSGESLREQPRKFTTKRAIRNRCGAARSPPGLSFPRGHLLSRSSVTPRRPSMAIVHALLVLFLLLVFPVWDRVETRRLKSSTDPRARVRAYRITIGWQLVATAILLLTIRPALLFAPPALGGLFGLREVPEDARAVGIGILAGLLAGAAIPVLLLRRRQPGKTIPNPLESIAFILPRDREERAWFGAMCLVVGVCEEIIFRGFLIRYLQGLPLGPGLLGAILVAAAIFGIDHGYQGWKGILGTGLLALVMTALFFVTGTLWIPILAHALLDLRVLLLPHPAHPAAAPE